MICSRAVFAAVAAAFGIASALPSARAAASHVALVIGNGTYTSLPAIPGCLLSAHAVAAALRGAGFDVVESEDATSGATDAALAEAGRRLGAAPGATAFVYVCAYATSFNDRPFVLPVAANIARPTDVLTQGVLARSLIEMLTRGGARSAVLTLDVVPAPGAPSTLGFGAAVQGDLPDGLGSIAVSQAHPQDAPTPLAASLVADLKAATVQIGPLLTATQQQLAANQALSIVAIHVPPGQAYLIGASAPVAGPVPPAPVPPAPAPTTPAPAPAAPAPAPSAQAAPTAPPSLPTAVLPDEPQMTEADRRRVQMALGRLGYYDGQVDGVFGPDTRAAIRRYQHELHLEMTGRLTAEQATRLVGGR